MAQLSCRCSTFAPGDWSAIICVMFELRPVRQHGHLRRPGHCQRCEMPVLSLRHASNRSCCFQPSQLHFGTQPCEDKERSAPTALNAKSSRIPRCITVSSPSCRTHMCFSSWAAVWYVDAIRLRASHLHLPFCRVSRSVPCLLASPRVIHPRLPRCTQ